MAEIVSGDRRLSRELFLERAARAATGLQALGVGPGDAIALFLRNDIAFLEAAKAAGWLGAYPVAVNWHSTEAEAAYILSDCGARVVVVHADLLPTVRAAIPSDAVTLVVATPPEVRRAYGLGEIPPPDADASWDEWLTRHSPFAASTAEAPGAIIYTSGTTGRPKGVRRETPTEAQAKAAAAAIAASYGLGASDESIVALVTAPLYHSAPNSQAMSAIRIGATIILQPRFDAEELLQLIERWRVTHLYLAPIMFNRLLKLPEAVRRRYDLTSLRFAVHAAAPCPADIKRTMIDWWGPIIHEFYGSTETRAVTACNTAEWLERPGTVGRALAGATVRVVDEHGQDQPPGEVGEIVCGLSAAAGFTYHGDDQKRRAIDRGGLIATGDVGYLDEAGYLFICDRTTDMIISGGVNIYPAEIEAVLSGAPGVLDCAVFGIPDEEYGEAIMAVVQSVDGRRLDPDILRAHVRSHVAGYKTPRRIEQVDELPRQDSGKIFKRKLRAPFWEGAQRRI